MAFSRFSLCPALLLLFGSQIGWTQTQALAEVFHDDHFQLTGVTVSKSGRLFVNYPRWSDTYRNAVVEIAKGGSAKPYPDQAWNLWDSKPATASSPHIS
jgi:hypothetical protein